MELEDKDDDEPILLLGSVSEEFADKTIDERTTDELLTEDDTAKGSCG